MDRTLNAMYAPPSKVLVDDDFDRGLCGWCSLTPNLSNDSMEYLESQKRYKLWGGPMLSIAPFQFLGSHGSGGGMYSMKLATRPVAGPPEVQPVPGSMAHALKRLTFRDFGLIKMEMVYTFKPEQDRPGIGDKDVRAIGFLCDVQDEESRYFWGFRYLNSAGGNKVGKWQIFRAWDGTDEEWGDMGVSAVGEGEQSSPTYLARGIDGQWLGRRFENGDADGFTDVPDGAQSLCYNETVDKINWQYVGMTFDLKTRRYVELESINRKFDLRSFAPTLVRPYPRVTRLLNPCVWLETDTNRRAFLFVDSIVISVDDIQRTA